MNKPRVEGVAGRKYGLLTAVSVFRGSGRKRFWRCQCQCGKTHAVKEFYLVSGYTKSCGCLRGAKQKTHGLSKHPSYFVHSGMMRRCYNPKCKAWPNYGGRGIKVAERWHDVAEFIKDVGVPTTPKHQIDRVDNNGDYSPDNWRWSTPSEQRMNMRTNRVLEIDGVSKTITAWARQNRLSPSMVFTRIHRGWSEIEAVTSPVRQNIA